MAARFQVNLPAVSAGLIIAIIISILCCTITLAPSKLTVQVPGTGLLHLIWLYLYHPDLLHLLRNVKEPTEDNLRSAGLVTVEFSEAISNHSRRSTQDLEHKNMDLNQTTLKSSVNSIILSAPTTERYKAPGSRAHILLRITSIALHILLILLHLLLLGLWAAPHLEHKVVFLVDHQGVVALWITVIATSFGTIYLSITPYVIQKLAIHSDLCKEQTLTSTHDHLLSWTGTGSAFLNLWKQLRLPASVLGTVTIFCYFPLHRLKDFQSGQAQIMKNLDEFKTLGLFNGSLYDVLSTTNQGDGEAMVSAVGFNITCGYLRGVNVLDVQIPVDRETSSQWPGYDYIHFSFKSLGPYFTFINPTTQTIPPLKHVSTQQHCHQWCGLWYRPSKYHIMELPYCLYGKHTGHIHPAPLRLKYQLDSGNVTPPVLSTSSAPLVQVVSAAQLNISLGLGSSIILFGLAIRFWHICTHSGLKPDGTGLLHIMWLSQRHSKVITQLKQVQEPTNNNLRAVGMIKVQLLGYGGEESEKMWYCGTKD
ncbi:hypothetical protein B0H17DRAFT_1154178 [Mycena rosella]|uniref:Uncharacterized protein n=1 Tax=Mycena rosella TaxID=1033263 RepID=A0AAD7AZY3_MYCRO|nr:hypothetical protein B0H17DRAFT_1154178 [Mycena rosella]